MYCPGISFLLFLLLSLGVVHASPLSRDTGKVNIATSTKINKDGITNVVEMDRARIQSMKQALSLNEHGGGQVNATNHAFLFTAEVGVGTPPISYTLIVDTGSSNTWIGGSKPYVVTNSSVNTGDVIFVEYGSGLIVGEEWLDTVTLAPELVIKKQSIGVATWAHGISPYDGILGVGTVDLTVDTVNNTHEVPTVTDNLYSQGKISQEILGVFFPPPSENSGNGELTFGGHDDSLTTSMVTYVPITNNYPVSKYWGIDQSISYGGETILSSKPGIVDTGTTLIHIATDAYHKYMSLTGATYDPITQFLTITSVQYANLRTLSFDIGGTSYNLCPNAQIWPRSLNSAIGGNASAIYLFISDLGSRSSDGVGSINGYGFLQRFYSIYDTTNQRIGFAETMYTYSGIN